MTDPDDASGTDRVAEVARDLSGVDIIVNVQGDEPEIAAEDIDAVVQLLEDDPAVPMATLATPIRSREKLESLRESRVRCRRAGAVFQPQPDPGCS